MQLGGTDLDDPTTSLRGSGGVDTKGPVMLQTIRHSTEMPGRADSTIQPRAGSSSTEPANVALACGRGDHVATAVQPAHGREAGVPRRSCVLGRRNGEGRCCGDCQHMATF
jgi:hypothetical protein